MSELLFKKKIRQKRKGFEYNEEAVKHRRYLRKGIQPRALCDRCFEAKADLRLQNNGDLACSDCEENKYAV